ncbi:ABC transporter permease [Parapedobacter tibetensis]|uniref:ABC transporter permease n=1 Tax=Parapedobacter tibetensis TaxID=2972951 RepID=UPI00214DA479|nr:ABC transporter permease [Parapedobacter tibetensis]
MITNIIKIAWRNIIKNKLYTLLHILGLGLGLATCLFLYTYIAFHHSFDRFHPKADRTFRLVSELHLQKTEYSKGASYAMYKAPQTEMPEVEDATFLLGNQEFTLKIGERLYKTGQQAALASSNWFELFDFDWLKGNPKDLDEVNSIALTAKSAETYFGNADPMGQIILVDNKHPFKVVGVIDDSRSNTSLKAELYLSLNSIRSLQPDIMDAFFSYWRFINSSNNVFVSLQHPLQKEAVEQKLMQLAAKNLDPSVTNVYNFKLLPLEEVHFDMNYGGTAKKSLLVVLAIVGGCIMVVASINYINLSIAQQARRSVEIGTRKVLGESGKQLFIQFLIESILITLVALCLSFAFIQLAIAIALSTVGLQVIKAAWANPVDSLRDE